jgi:23S rRNA (cytosine1962-C5)-methyltransferase
LVLAAPLFDRIAAAIDRRHGLIQSLAAEGTDALRLFHGAAEGEPGLTIDRYGSLLLAQTFREPLSHDEAEQLGAFLHAHLGQALPFVCNHRGEHPQSGVQLHAPADAALQEMTFRERGLSLAIQARHRGQDPWLFLDLRAARRLVHQTAKGKRVLNLFAYTCGVGLMASAAGAANVINVDFAQSSLAIGAHNAKANGLAGDRFRLLQSDCIPVLRQLARLPVQRRGRGRPYPKVEPQEFDLVFLDPPRWAKGPFGAIDVVRDYASLFKPCVLTAAADGVVIATNHVPTVTAEDWTDQLRRCAAKAGRPLRDLTLVTPDADFPAFDGKPPLKVAVCQL